MRIILVPLVAVFISDFAHAGATHSWCENIELPNIRVCVDQTGEFLETETNMILPFKFAGYGEDHSIVHFTAEGSEFKLVTTSWGSNQFLIDSQSTEHQLLCGEHQHGLCPRAQVRGDGITVDYTRLELTCEEFNGNEQFEVRRSDSTNKIYFFGKGAAPANYIEFTQHPEGWISAGNYIVFQTKNYAFNEWTYERFTCHSPKAEQL